jgi:hypothetical protein
MRLTMFLSSRYVRGHPRQCVGSMLCAALFFTAVLTTLLYRNSAAATLQQEHWKEYGSYSYIAYCADPQKVVANSANLRASGSGLVQVTQTLSTPESNQQIRFGSMDANAIEMKAIQLKDGRFPESVGEIAVESATLKALNPNAAVGSVVTLHFSNGGTGTYRLVGILDDYITHWQSNDGTKTSVKYPPPVVITVPDGGTVEYEHVLCGTGFSGDLGSPYLPEINSGLHYSGNKDSVLNALTLPLLGFFVVVMGFGLLNLTNFTVREHRLEMELLWNIGISRRRLVFLYYFQGLALFISAGILSAVISPLLCWGMTRLTSVFGSATLLSFQWESFLIAGLVGLICIFLARTVCLSSLLGARKNAKAMHRSRKNYVDIPSLWHKAIKAENRAQSITSALLAAFCIFLAMFGAFVSVIAPRDNYTVATQTQNDYELYVAGGAKKDFNISLPRNTGIAGADLQTLYHTDGLQINYAKVSSMTSHYFLLRKGQTNNYLDYLTRNASANSEKIYSYGETDAIRQAGGQQGDKMISAGIIGLDWPSVQKQYPVFSNGSLHEGKFKSGEELLGPDSHCKIGDTFTIITPLTSDALPDEDISRKITFHISQATVAATYHPTSVQAPMIMSGEFIMKADPTSRYEDVSLNSLVNNDPTKRAKIEGILSSIAAHSRYVTMDNLVLERENLTKMTRNMQLQTTVAIFGFLLIVLLALSLSAYVNVKTNMHSYLLMRAIGIRREIIKKLLWRETWGAVWKGTFAGALFALLLTIVTTRGFAQYPLRLFVPQMCIAGAVAFGLIWGFSALAIIKPIGDLLKHSISEELASTE